MVIAYQVKITPEVPRILLRFIQKLSHFDSASGSTCKNYKETEFCQKKSCPFVSQWQLTSVTWKHSEQRDARYIVRYG